MKHALPFLLKVMFFVDMKVVYRYNFDFLFLYREGMGDAAELV